MDPKVQRENRRKLAIYHAGYTFKHAGLLIDIKHTLSTLPKLPTESDQEHDLKQTLARALIPFIDNYLDYVMQEHLINLEKGKKDD